MTCGKRAGGKIAQISFDDIISVTGCQVHLSGNWLILCQKNKFSAISMTASQPVCTLIKFSEFSIDPTGQQADKLVGFFLNERLTTESLFERIENRSVCFTNFKQSNLSDLFVIGQIHLTGFAFFAIL
jgi:hypothetical protein